MSNGVFNSPFEEFIYVRTYSRWIDELGRRENWHETVKRYSDFMIQRVSEGDIDRFNEATNSILNFNVMPSMRALWTAGKALERESICGYNCFSGDTKFLTYNGVRALGESIGPVKVLNRNQEWVDGEVKSFGNQKTVELMFGYNNITKKVRVTLDHNWYLSNGNIVKTKELKHGDIIDYNKYNRKNNYDSIDYKLGVIHGIVYGDGTASWKKGRKTKGQLSYSQKRVMGYMIRLCSDQEDFLPFFDEYEKSYPSTYGGDPVVYLYDSFAKTHDLKSLPNENETEDYIIGFIRGWFAADGYVSKSGFSTLCMDDVSLEWSKKTFHKYGYYLQKIQKLCDKTNYGERTKNQYNVGIDRSSLSKDDILIKRKRDRFECFSKDYTIRGIVEGSEKVQEVFCVTEPKTHTFTLDSGLLTGNCSGVIIDDPAAFSEILYILMCGTGAGFSVERQFINKMPDVPSMLTNVDDTIVFVDSKLGWADGYAKYVRELYKGNILKIDTSKIRAKGKRLKTFGGRASGPEPLIKLINFTCNIFKNAKGRKLNSIECHDIVCYIASIVVVGGVRRSATISLSNLSDNRMAHAKDGNYFNTNPQRSLANNSVAYTEKPDCISFLDEWTILARSQTGERGIFNREGVIKHLKKHVPRRNPNFDFVVNPCGEIVLRNQGFCNLTEVVVRPDDTLETLLKKVEDATILGCVQSTLTKFKFLRKQWTDNAEEERLLGVSLTGLRDHPTLNHVHNTAKYWLEELKNKAVQTSKIWASKLGINEPAAVTCVKPSGCTGLFTEVKTTDGTKSMLDIFHDNDINAPELYNSGTWIDVSKDIKVYDENNDEKLITKLFINGMSDVYDIEFEDGSVYPFTGEHKFKTNNGWKRVDELSENDIIISF